MESELKELTRESRPEPPEPAEARAKSEVVDDASNRDDRPLLKRDSTAEAATTSSAVAAVSIEELGKKYAAYVRHDLYGPMGRGPLPWTEKALLGFAFFTLVPLRLVLGMTILLLYYSICKVCTACLGPNCEDEQEDYAHLSGWRRAVVVRSGKFLSRALLFVLGFYWIKETRRDSCANHKLNAESVDKAEPVEDQRPGAIVSNHVSYVDILYHMSSTFPSFVAKRSVARLPLVGLISKCLGCVYVQRESKSSDFKGVSGVVTERVCEAHQSEFAPMMLLFPEGTTTNGDFLLPFKTGAFLSKCPVLPVILKYPYKRFSPAWDSISGVWHVTLLLCQFVNHMEVTRLPVYCPSQKEKDDSKLYANNVRSLMAHEGNLILSDIGLAEKRVYLAALNGNNSVPTVLHQKEE